MHVKVGFITPTFNRPAKLVALHASMAQPEMTGDWCHYVVDDGSSADYTDAFAICNRLSGRLRYERILNSGALIARNRAMAMALKDGCTHVCFLDDDDEVVPHGIQLLYEQLGQSSTADWFMFRSQNDRYANIDWPAEPILASWFDDVVRRRAYGSDNVIVISTRLLGDSRFSAKGRNQREWAFFLDLSRKHDEILVCPQTIGLKKYCSGGLTDQAQNRRPSWEQTCNNVERSFRYWLMRPTSPKLMISLLKQSLLLPPRVLLTALHRSTIRHGGRRT